MTVVAACGLLTVSVFLVANVADIASRDFIEYWAAGQQLVRGANPYDVSRISAIERSAGKFVPIVMFNPPSALFLTLPLGIIRPQLGYMLWSVLVIGAWIGSIHMLWIMNGRPRNALHRIGLFFAPAVACLLLGQMSAFVLLGLTLFLYFHRTRPLVAGAALLLCGLKPHLLLPFGVALLPWVVTYRAYRLLSGVIVAFVIAGIVPLIFDPNIYAQYAAMSHSSTPGVAAAFIPTLSELLRIVIDPGAFWIQFLPAAAGCIWAFWYFYRYRNEWDWRRHGPLLILVSFLVAPYAWYFDATILLPSILYAAYRARPTALAVLFVLLAVDAAQLLLHTRSQSAWYLWPSVAWLVWYLWSMHLGSTRLREMLGQNEHANAI